MVWFSTAHVNAYRSHNCFITVSSGVFHARAAIIGKHDAANFNLQTTSLHGVHLAPRACLRRRTSRSRRRCGCSRTPRTSRSWCTACMARTAPGSSPCCCWACWTWTSRHAFPFRSLYVSRRLCVAHATGTVTLCLDATGETCRALRKAGHVTVPASVHGSCSPRLSAVGRGCMGSHTCLCCI